MEWHKKPNSVDVPQKRVDNCTKPDLPIMATTDHKTFLSPPNRELKAGWQISVGEEQAALRVVHAINAPQLLDQDSIRCDTLVYVNEERATVKIIEITQREVRYEPCGENVVPETKSIQLKYVHKVVYANGQEEDFKTLDENERRQPSQRAGLEIYGLISLILNVIGLVLLVFPFGMYVTIPVGLVAAIHAIVSLQMFRKHPDITGKGFAIAGLIISILMIALGVYFLQAFIL